MLTERALYLISIVGPPGAGKTTLVTLLRQRYSTGENEFYIEDISDNPHLVRPNEPSPNLDFGNSQLWFLNSYDAFFSASKNLDRLFVDQDPSAVVAVYSKLLLKRGLLSQTEYDGHFLRAHEVETRISDRKRLFFYLKASPVLIRSRLAKRSDKLTEVFGTFETIVSEFDRYIDEVDADALFQLDATSSPESLADTIWNTVSNRDR